MIKRSIQAAAPAAVTSAAPTIRFDNTDIKNEAIGSMILWKDNPRKNDAAVPRLAKIISEHGQRTPIVAWRKNRVVYKGNTTLKAMRQAGAKTISVLWADFPSEQAAIAYGIADNRSSEFAGWDSEILSRLLKATELKKMNTGFTEKELSDIVVRQQSNLGVTPQIIAKCARILPPISPDIYNYALCKDGTMLLSDLEVFIELDISGPPALRMMSREYIAKGLPFDSCVVSGIESKDFLPHPKKPKTADVLCLDSYGLGRLAGYASNNLGRSTLTFVYTSSSDKLIFATNGHKALYRKEVSISKDAAIPKILCEVLDALQHSGRIEFDGDYLYADGRGYRVACKYSTTEQVPKLAQVIPKAFSCKFAYDTSAMHLDSIEQILAAEKGEAALRSNSLTVIRSKGKPVEFILPAIFAPEGRVTVNARLLLEVIRDVGSGEVSYPSGIGPIVLSGQQFSGLVMPLKLSADVCLQSVLRFEYSAKVGYGGISYRLTPGNIQGTIELGSACSPVEAMKNLFGEGGGVYTKEGWEYFGGKLKAKLI